MGAKYYERGKKKKKGEREREKSIRGKIKKTSCTEGGTNIYFPPICMLHEGKNIIKQKGGRKEYDFLGKYIPLLWRERLNS